MYCTSLRSVKYPTAGNENLLSIFFLRLLSTGGGLFSLEKLELHSIASCALKINLGNLSEIWSAENCQTAA